MVRNTTATHIDGAALQYLVVLILIVVLVAAGKSARGILKVWHRTLVPFVPGIWCAVSCRMPQIVSFLHYLRELRNSNQFQFQHARHWVPGTW